MWTVIVTFPSIGTYPYSFQDVKAAGRQFREAVRMGTASYVGLYFAVEPGIMAKRIEEWRG